MKLNLNQLTRLCSMILLSVVFTVNFLSATRHKFNKEKIAQQVRQSLLAEQKEKKKLCINIVLAQKFQGQKIKNLHQSAVQQSTKNNVRLEDQYEQYYAQLAPASETLKMKRLLTLSAGAIIVPLSWMVACKKNEYFESETCSTIGMMTTALAGITAVVCSVHDR